MYLLIAFIDFSYSETYLNAGKVRRELGLQSCSLHRDHRGIGRAVPLARSPPPPPHQRVAIFGGIGMVLGGGGGGGGYSHGRFWATQFYL